MIRGSLVDPRFPLEWIDPEDKDHDPCPPRETGWCNPAYAGLLYLSFYITRKVLEQKDSLKSRGILNTISPSNLIFNSGVYSDQTLQGFQAMKFSPPQVFAQN